MYVDNYDWVSMKMIRKGDDTDLTQEAGIDIEVVPGGHVQTEEEEAEEQAKLNKASQIAKTMTAILTVCFLILWPLPMYGTGYVYSSQFFTGWVSIGILWLFCSTFCVGIYPLWEGRHSLVHTFSSMWKDITGKRSPKQMHAHAEVVEGKDGGSGSQSPRKSLAEEKIEPHAN